MGGKTTMKEQLEVDWKKIEKARKHDKDLPGKISAWERVQIARHPQRPGAKDYISALFSDFTELHGDRLFGDDRAIIAGPARFEGQTVMVIAQEKGKGVKERVARNFGMPHPEGYRKALRMMQMAEHFGWPVITWIDTPGAYPGAEAEERGQSVAIAQNLRAMAQLKTPIVSVVIGEGGSGGALALSLADTLLMLEYAIYSVISPEGCAAILWSDETKAKEAAEAMKITAPELQALGVIDGIIPEPVGGAHLAPATVVESLKCALMAQLALLSGLSVSDRLNRRDQRFRKMGLYSEKLPS
jgi:acetyl-CoA carboxylase carboxyl transferase subunit alpha